MDENIGSDLQQEWLEIHDRHENVILRILEENRVLHDKVEQLESEKFTLQKAFSKLRQEVEDSESAKRDLQSKLASLTHREEEIVLTLLDGDGYIFDRTLLCKGESGGREAAQILTNGIMRYIAKQPDRPSQVVLWTMWFLSREKLEATLVRSGVCSQEQFRYFMKGFSSAHPLFSVVDVSDGKEAADAKIREHLRKFIKHRSFYRVILGVDHDNGYDVAISAEMTNGYANRMVLLRAHSNIARQIEALQLGSMSIDDLFLVDGLGPGPSSVVLPQRDPWSSFKTRAYASPVMEKRKSVYGSPPSPIDTLASWRRDKAPTRDPAPCHAFYLTKRCCDKDCPYGHDYELSEQELQKLIQWARAQPCSYATEGERCPRLDCIYGHKCSRGSDCPFRWNGTCKFTGPDSHD